MLSGSGAKRPLCPLRQPDGTQDRAIRKRGRYTLAGRGDVARKRTKNQAPTPAGKARSDINDVASLAKVSRQTVTNSGSRYELVAL